MKKKMTRRKKFHLWQGGMTLAAFTAFPIMVSEVFNAITIPILIIAIIAALIAIVTTRFTTPLTAIAALSATLVQGSIVVAIFVVAFYAALIIALSKGYATDIDQSRSYVLWWLLVQFIIIAVPAILYISAIGRSF